MPRGRTEEEHRPGLQRTCHLCGKVVDSRVWYARNEEHKKRRSRYESRVYACPPCFFSLKDSERKEYYRERV